MGVMNCSRKGCEDIMCDTYIQEIGYICMSCQTEFKDYMSEQGVRAPNRGEIMKNLEEFMKTKPGFHNDEQIDLEDFFKENTRK